MSKDRRYVSTGTTDIIHMTAHHTATTVRSGLMAERLSVLARGMATVDIGAAAGTVEEAGVTQAVATDARAMAEEATPTVALTEAAMPAEVMPTVALSEAAMPAASPEAGVDGVSMAAEVATMEADLTAADPAAADPAAADPTVADPTVADTGKGLQAWKRFNGWQHCAASCFSLVIW